MFVIADFDTGYIGHEQGLERQLGNLQALLVGLDGLTVKYLSRNPSRSGWPSVMPGGLKPTR